MHVISLLSKQWPPLWHLASADETNQPEETWYFWRNYPRMAFEISTWEVQGYRAHSSAQVMCPDAPGRRGTRAGGTLPRFQCCNVTCSFESGFGPKDVRVLSCCRLLSSHTYRLSKTIQESTQPFWRTWSLGARFNMGKPIPRLIVLLWDFSFLPQRVLSTHSPR